MNYIVQHEQYPHWCRIYRHNQTGSDLQFESEADEQFSELEEETCECKDSGCVCGCCEDDITVLYEGECVKYGSSQMRKYVNGSTIKADHAVDIPDVVFGINPGDLIDVRDGNGEWREIEVVVPFPDDVFGMGTTVFFNIAFN